MEEMSYRDLGPLYEESPVIIHGPLTVYVKRIKKKSPDVFACICGFLYGEERE